MVEKKYRCQICGQIVVPNPDGSCPICGAPREMLVEIADEDEDK